MWKADLLNWKDVSEDLYKYFFDAGEKRLKEILDESEKITSRAYSLIGFIIPISSITLAQLISDFGYNCKSYITLLSLLISIYLLFQLLKVINVRNTWYLGTEPQEIVTDNFTSFPGLSETEIKKALYLSEIEHIQEKITANKQINNDRIEKFRHCLITSFVTLSIMLAVLIANKIIL